jgi:hypothetical protein
LNRNQTIMSTPGFIAQNANSLTPVRYYTQYDPYHYATDNRPLTDLSANITTISSGGGDSARRTVLLNELAMSSVFHDLFTSSTNALYVSGLAVTYPNVNTLVVNPGAVYEAFPINDTIATVTTKQALLLAPVTFNLVSPSTAGTSIAYVIEAQFSDLTSGNMASSALPFLDATNTFLPGLLLNKELVLQLKAGTQAATGTQVEPTIDAGWFPIYTVVMTYGVTNPAVYANANAPAFKGLSQYLAPVALTTGSATVVSVGGVPSFSFAHGSTQGVSLPISIRSASVNPFVPIKLKINFSADTTGGNFAFALSYLCTTSGDSVTATPTSTATEAIPMTGAANTLETFSTVIMTIPVSAFTSVVGGNWAVSKDKLFVTLQRTGAVGADTNTGNFHLHDVTAYQ